MTMLSKGRQTRSFTTMVDFDKRDKLRDKILLLRKKLKTMEKQWDEMYLGDEEDEE